MAKEDVPPLPERIPTKRRQVEQLLDVHIAMWLADESISFSERKRLENEKRRRKNSKLEVQHGVVVPKEGVTPEQQQIFSGLLLQERVQVVHHHILPSRLHQLCRIAAQEVVVHRGGEYGERLRSTVRNSDFLFAFPKELREPDAKVEGTVWWAVKYAKHRGLPVTVVLPNGKVLSGT